MEHCLPVVTLPNTPCPADNSREELRPRSRLYLVRLIRALLLESGGMDNLKPSTRHDLRRMVAIAVGPVQAATLDWDVERLVLLMNVIESALNASLEEVPSDHLLGIADEVAKAMSFRDSERALLCLSFHVAAVRELSDALAMFSARDAEGAAPVFAQVLLLDEAEVQTDLCAQNPMRQLSPMEASCENHKLQRFLLLPTGAMRVLRAAQCTADQVLALMFRPSPPPRLTMSDYEGAGPMVPLLSRYLGAALHSGRPGINVLLHGKPGTGKTELVRALAGALGGALVEVPAIDEDRDPLPPLRRLAAYDGAQRCLCNRQDSLILFDEVEDVFPAADPFGSGFANHGRPQQSKGWMTELLDTNPRPGIWVCNRIDQIDPAFIRRFDMVIELEGPDRSVRDRLVDHLFAGIALPAASLELLKEQSHFVPGHLERMATVMRTLAPANDEEGGLMISQLSSQILKVLNTPAPPAPMVRRAATTLLTYRSDCVNVDVDLEALTQALGRLASARICLYGPPGTGKTEWARQLAQRLDKPLLVKRASDLLGMYLGQSEKKVRDAFREAHREGAVLMIDEADSMLRDRSHARQQWEVSIVNEMLTAMESFEGVFVASTNLVGDLDAASARRFDFKVSFKGLRPPQCALLFAELLKGLGVPDDGADLLPWSELRDATPGDFANVFRQARLGLTTMSATSLFDLLRKELSFRHGQVDSRRIGFV